MEEELIFCKTGGCGAKLGPGALDKILKLIPKKKDENLLVGFDYSDDAAVYQLTDNLAIVQTLDFFPPMVEDPFLFGKIAATNALSDIYAMGGEVKTALNIVCFPENMDLNILGKIIQGGNEKVMEAGGVLAGGHSIHDEGVKYGLSVTGVVHPKRILTNHNCQVGDDLILTKPLGVGIVMTASRIGEADESAMTKAITSMTTLNKYASEIFCRNQVHACTDVTGFGFLGHLSEMLGEEFSAEIKCENVPYIKEAECYAKEFYLTAAAQRNRNHVEQRVAFLDVPFAMEEILYDPQTSGGLLASVPHACSQQVLTELKTLGLSCNIVGSITEKKEKSIIIK